MRKYRPFKSLSYFLGSNIEFINKLRNTYFRYNKYDDEPSFLGAEPIYKMSPYILGGLNPLISSHKDIINTFKPYKTSFYLYRDFLLPLRGAGNVIKSGFNLCATPMVLLAKISSDCYSAYKNNTTNGLLNAVTFDSAMSVGWMLEGLSCAIRGAGQILFSPLCWFARMPMRGLLTILRGRPSLEQNLRKKSDQVESLVNKRINTVDDTIKIDSTLDTMQRTLERSMRRGQKTHGINTQLLLKKLTGRTSFTLKTHKSPLQQTSKDRYFVVDNKYAYRPYKEKLVDSTIVANDIIDLCRNNDCPYAAVSFGDIDNKRRSDMSNITLAI